MGVVAATSRTAAGRVPALGGAAVAGTGLATACMRRVLQLAAGAGTAGVDDLVELLVVAVGAVVLAWLAGSAAVAATCLVARSTGRRWRAGEVWVRRFAPTVVRRALVVVVAAGIGAASVTTASAAEPAPPAGAVAVSAVTPGGDLGWVVTAPGGPTTVPETGRGTPSRDAGAASPTAVATQTTTPTPTPTPTPPSVPSPAAPEPYPSTTAPRVAPSPAATGHGDVTPGRAAPPARAAALPVPEAPQSTVVVARGDTLWGIAARHLPPGAGDARIAAAWPAWYAANAATIGPDPGLIRPGQALVVPEEAAR